MAERLRGRVGASVGATAGASLSAAGATPLSSSSYSGRFSLSPSETPSGSGASNSSTSASASASASASESTESASSFRVETASVGTGEGPPTPASRSAAASSEPSSRREPRRPRRRDRWPLPDRAPSRDSSSRSVIERSSKRIGSPLTSSPRVSPSRSVSCVSRSLSLDRPRRPRPPRRRRERAPGARSPGAVASDDSPRPIASEARSFESSAAERSSAGCWAGVRLGAGRSRTAPVDSLSIPTGKSSSPRLRWLRTSKSFVSSASAASAEATPGSISRAAITRRGRSLRTRSAWVGSPAGAIAAAPR